MAERMMELIFEEDIIVSRRPRIIRERVDLFEILDDKDFEMRFRLSKRSALAVLESIEYQLEFPSDRNNAVSPINQLLCTLRYFATGSTLLAAGDFGGFSTTTAHRIIHRDGTTPLILAAASGYVDCVRELLDQGADPAGKRLTGTTALFFAAQGGFLDVAETLLDRGAAVDSPSVDGGTPLFVACQCGHMDVVKELVRRGAKVNTHMKDRATPLFIAAQNGHFKILLFLLAQGAEPDPRRTDGATPLWIAAQMGHDHIVRQLLKAGAHVDATRHDGATALFKAAHKGHSSVVEQLLKHKPSLGLLPNGETALHAAALFGHVSAVKQLLAAGADSSLQNQEGATPLQLACEAKHSTIVEYLSSVVTTSSKLK